jgi:Uma2 family endonuclease
MVVRAGVSTKIAYAADVLWAIEVSDATRRKDLKIKAPLYAAAAIPDYWVIDLERSVTHIHRNPSASGWGEIVEASFEQEIAPGSFPDLNIVIGSL